MAVYFQNGGVAHAVDTSRIMYTKVGGQVKQVLQLWVKQAGAWHREPTYNPTLAAPTNLRMNPANAGDHNYIPVAWDYNSALVPNDFYLLLSNENDVGLWATTVSGSTRSYTFGPVSQNYKYRIRVYARMPGLADQVSNVGQWRTGWDPQPYQVPVYNWKDDFEWVPSGSYFNYCTSYQPGSEPNYTPEEAVRGNAGDNNYWLSGPMTEPFMSAAQGEGMQFYLPNSVHWRLRGVHVRPTRTHDVWFGIRYGGVWYGSPSNTPYAGKYGGFNHVYYGATGSTRDTVINVGGGDNFISDAYGDSMVQILYRQPQDWSDAGLSYPRVGCYGVAFIMQTFGVIRYDTYYTAAVDSGYW